MGRIVFIVVVFIFGFIIGAGVGFQILQGVSSDIVVQAFENSYSGFNKAYAGSTVQAKLNEAQHNIEVQIKAGLKDYLTKKISSIF